LHVNLYKHNIND